MLREFCDVKAAQPKQPWKGVAFYIQNASGAQEILASGQISTGTDPFAG